jgi:hypothetical protein
MAESFKEVLHEATKSFKIIAAMAEKIIMEMPSGGPVVIPEGTYEPVRRLIISLSIPKHGPQLGADRLKEVISKVGIVKRVDAAERRIISRI